MQSHMLTTMEVTIAEAATRLKVSQDTIRRRIRSHQVTSRQVHRPQGYIWLVEVDQDTPTPPEPVKANGQQSEVTWLREQLEARTREIAELHQLLAAQSLNPSKHKPWWAFWR